MAREREGGGAGVRGIQSFLSKGGNIQTPAANWWSGMWAAPPTGYDLQLSSGFECGQGVSSVVKRAAIPWSFMGAGPSTGQYRCRCFGEMRKLKLATFPSPLELRKT